MIQLKTARELVQNLGRLVIIDTDYDSYDPQKPHNIKAILEKHGGRIYAVWKHRADTRCGAKHRSIPVGYDSWQLCDEDSGEVYPTTTVRLLQTDESLGVIK